ncbi:MAG: ubiquitin-like domain-containing protein [Candidatus Hodarchaeota archaeon]
MKGVFLCKFDEIKGYIPIEPLLIDNDEYLNNEILLEEIARNAIGFGSFVEFNSFSLSGINCISRRFSVSIQDARGGSAIYSLVIIADEDVMKFKTLLTETVETLSDWKDIKGNLKRLYDAINYAETPFHKEETKESVKVSVPKESKEINVHFMSTIGPGEKKEKLLLDTGNNVGTIKESVGNLFGLSPADFYLSYGGVTMEETNLLMEYGIKDGDTILLLPTSTAG